MTICVAYLPQLVDTVNSVINLVKLATDNSGFLLTSMKGFSYFVATSAPFPVASFTKLTVQQIAEILQQRSLISKTTVDLNTKGLCKVWFCCSGCLLQDFCNLLYNWSLKPHFT